MAKHAVLSDRKPRKGKLKRACAQAEARNGARNLARRQHTVARRCMYSDGIAHCDAIAIFPRFVNSVCDLLIAL